MDIKIEKIIVKVGNKELSLTVDEAHSLHNELSSLLGKNNYYPAYPIMYPMPSQLPIPPWSQGPTCERHAFMGTISAGFGGPLA